MPITTGEWAIIDEIRAEKRLAEDEQLAVLDRDIARGIASVFGREADLEADIARGINDSMATPFR